MTGAQCNSMVIEVYGNDDKFLCRLDNNDALIGSYPIDDGARLHVHELLCIPVACCLCVFISAVFLHCWSADREGIRPVENSMLAVPVTLL